MVGSHAERAAGNEDHRARSSHVRRALFRFSLSLRHHDLPHGLGSALPAVIPEPLRAGRIGVVPAHARRRGRACPCGRRCSRDHANRGASRDRAAAGPAIRSRPRPADAAATISRPHHRSAADRWPAHHRSAPIGRGIAARSNRNTTAAHDRANFDDVAGRCCLALGYQCSAPHGAQGGRWAGRRSYPADT